MKRNAAAMLRSSAAGWSRAVHRASRRHLEWGVVSPGSGWVNRQPMKLRGMMRISMMIAIGIESLDRKARMRKPMGNGVLVQNRMASQRRELRS